MIKHKTKNQNKTKFKLQNKKFIQTTVIFTIILTLIDILTKYIFTNKTYFQDSLIYIHYIQNFGSAFSMFSNISIYNTLIIILSLIVLTILIKYYSEFKSSSKLSQITYILILSGLLGNLFDRIIFGHVRDFIGLKYLFIFNIADVYLTFAVIFYIYLEYIQKQKLSQN